MNRTDQIRLMTEFAINRQTALWNRTVPKLGMHIKVGETHTRYLHPTKGWRRVANKRLGI